MERYFGAVLHSDLVAGLHFMSVCASIPLASSTTAARSPSARCTTDFCRWSLREKYLVFLCIVAVVQKNQKNGHKLEETEENMGREERIGLELQEYYSMTTCIVMVVMLHL